MTRFTLVHTRYFQQALYTQLSVAAEAGFVTLTDFDFLTQPPSLSIQQVEHACPCYARKRSLGQGNIFSPVCHSVHRGRGVCLSACWDTTLSGADPSKQAPTPGSRHLPIAGTPMGAEHAERYCQRAGGTHPTGMQSCFLEI